MSSRNEREIAMNTVLQTLHSLYESFLNLPHHRMAYGVAAAVAVLLIGIPLLRLIFGSSSNSEEPVPVERGYPSMFGLTSAPVDVRPAPIDIAPASNVTAIHGSLTVPCIHCGVTMSPRQDFCPACGYAQPMKQSFTA
jgi:hypothetical protein